MSVTRNDLQLRIQLANRIYDLDAEVYKCSGSTLGRVLTGERQKTINELARMLGNRTMSHYLRSEIALIGNMARSVQNKAERSRLMSEYNAVLQAVEAVPTSFGTIDILDVRFGSLWTNIPRELFLQTGIQYGDRVSITIENETRTVYRNIILFAKSFADVYVGEALAYVNSLDCVAVAINQGSFARAYNIGTGNSWSICIEPFKGF